ncbi:MAG: hypothetical protein WC384_21060 [Prolixibacteraceae bacterium]
MDDFKRAISIVFHAKSLSEMDVSQFMAFKSEANVDGNLIFRN